MPQVEQSWLELRGAQEDRLDEKADAAAHRALVESIATGGALAMFDRNSFVDESWRKVIVFLLLRRTSGSEDFIDKLRLAGKSADIYYRAPNAHTRTNERIDAGLQRFRLRFFDSAPG